MPSFSTQSAAKLLTCDYALQRLFNEVIKVVDCSIICGNRCKEDQEFAYETGHSKLQWPDSKHNSMPSMAVDVMPYPVDWSDMSRILAFAAIVKELAARGAIDIQWGGDFHTLKDYDHWQLKG